MSIQGAFLRILQERRFRPIGGKRETKSDFRLIAATNRDLDQMVQDGAFRPDLLFRLQSLVVDLPPLRERIKDVKDIAFFYISKFCDRYSLGTKGWSPEFLEALNTYHWPGNVRELINALERSVSVAHDELNLFPIHLPTHIRSQMARASFEPKQASKAFSDVSADPSDPFSDLNSLIETTETKYFQDLMAFTGGDIKEVCRISGLSRAQVYRLLKKYNITKRS
jgi:two-component system NtrC family response regulator